MRTQHRPNLGEMQSLWGMKSLGGTENAMRAWFEISSLAQEHATRFMSGRWAKDAAALAELGQCKSPVDALNLQVSYLRGAYADYVNEGQRIVGLFGDIVRETLPGVPPEQALSTVGKPKRRVAAH
jgi:hypothetical protein